MGDEHKVINPPESSGSGGEQWNSDRFRVVFWQYAKEGAVTEVAFDMVHAAYIQVYLEGHVDIASDVECMSLFPPQAILEMINAVSEAGIEEGKEQLKKEFRALMDLRGR
jgi:hypothetical protein